jgi:hypothetical protein
VVPAAGNLLNGRTAISVTTVSQTIIAQMNLLGLSAGIVRLAMPQPSVDSLQLLIALKEEITPGKLVIRPSIMIVSPVSIVIIAIEVLECSLRLGLKAIQ